MTIMRFYIGKRSPKEQAAWYEGKRVVVWLPERKSLLLHFLAEWQGSLVNLSVTVVDIVHTQLLIP